MICWNLTTLKIYVKEVIYEVNAKSKTKTDLHNSYLLPNTTQHTVTQAKQSIPHTTVTSLQTLATKELAVASR
jgi:hypothetical protein